MKRKKVYNPAERQKLIEYLKKTRGYKDSTALYMANRELRNRDYDKIRAEHDKKMREWRSEFDTEKPKRKSICLACGKKHDGERDFCGKCSRQSSSLYNT